MNGTIVDSVITAFGRSAARRNGIRGSRMGYVNTKAGWLRLIDTEGAKRVVVLTPDSPCVIEHYAELIESLAEWYRVICFDMPGVGFSFPAYNYSFGISESADCIVELLDALSIKSAAFAFTCANGFVSLNLAKRYPEYVSRLVLTQTPSLDSMRKWAARIIPKPLRVPCLGQGVAALKKELLATNWFDLAMPRDSAHKQEFIARARTAVRAGGCFCLASIVQGMLGAREEEIRGVTCPTVAIYGDSDFSHKHTNFHSIHEAVPHAKIAVFTGCGHFSNLERRSEYVQLVREFLQ